MPCGVPYFLSYAPPQIRLCLPRLAIATTPTPPHIKLCLESPPLAPRIRLCLESKSLPPRIRRFLDPKSLSPPSRCLDSPSIANANAHWGLPRLAIPTASHRAPPQLAIAALSPPTLQAFALATYTPPCGTPCRLHQPQPPPSLSSLIAALKPPFIALCLTPSLPVYLHKQCSSSIHPWLPLVPASPYPAQHRLDIVADIATELPTPTNIVVGI
jgi:hypothetical protein